MTASIESDTLHLFGIRPEPVASRRAATEEPSPTVRATLKAAPAIRNVYWCAFPRDMRAPEFWKTRPVVVVSHKNTLAGPVLVVPMTTQPQTRDRWAIKLACNPNPKDTCDVWVVCNHLYTVGCSRLSSFNGIVPRLTSEAFRPIHELILQWVPPLLPLDSRPQTA
ncbi:MAG: type II toxin-antitoxin system PemK/MazF family toxin [Acetobacteraceae bacterium]|nr:type II toxin-antitoxin system PemK/MazF family toxin [Acetobacteraceae bacterium]